MNTETRLKVEARIAHKLIDDALAQGFEVSVHEGVDWAIKRSTDAKAIKASLFSTDADRLYFTRPGQPTSAGTSMAFLVYGNDGYDVICDASVSAAPILAGAEALAERLERQYA